MYTPYFGLAEHPFNLTPDPRYLFLSRYHKEALDHLRYGIDNRKGFIVITGGIGTGKTTICRALLAQLGPEIRSALVLNPFVSGMELLQTLAQELGIQTVPGRRSRKEILDALNRLLLETFGRGGNAVLLIDESQNLSPEVLEQVRMLSNLETEREKLIQIVLSGQPELRELLASPALRPLDERITVRHHLRPLDEKDVRAYVEHRLAVAGGSGTLRFSRGALRRVYGYSQGNPRRINAVCDRALLVAYAREKNSVSAKTMDRAVADLRRDVGLFPSKAPLAAAWMKGALAAVLLMVLGLGGWRFMGVLSPPPPEAPETRTGRAGPDLSGTAVPEVFSLFLDDQTSLALLFDRTYMPRAAGRPDSEDRPLDLVTYRLPAEYHVLLKKPYRVLTAPPPAAGTDPLYLVIARPTAEGAAALDASRRERPVSREFILSHWGGTVSWIRAEPEPVTALSRGMRTDAVRRMQKALQALGYGPAITGGYDERTEQEVSAFQADFGLAIDGIAGPRTLTLLYHMQDG